MLMLGLFSKIYEIKEICDEWNIGILINIVFIMRIKEVIGNNWCLIK